MTRSMRFQVHSGLGQVLVHVGALLLRGLLHHSSIIRVHLPWQNLDWSEVPASAQVDDSSWHPAVPQHPQDEHQHQVGVVRTVSREPWCSLCFRLAQLISIFISVWLTAAGIIHLVSLITQIVPCATAGLRAHHVRVKNTSWGFNLDDR